VYKTHDGENCIWVVSSLQNPSSRDSRRDPPRLLRGTCTHMLEAQKGLPCVQQHDMRIPLYLPTELTKVPLILCRQCYNRPRYVPPLLRAKKCWGREKAAWRFCAALMKRREKTQEQQTATSQACSNANQRRIWTMQAWHVVIAKHCSMWINADSQKHVSTSNSVLQSLHAMPALFIFFFDLHLNKPGKSLFVVPGFFPFVSRIRY